MSDISIHLARPDVGNLEAQLVRQVLESKYLVDGPMTRDFEDTVAEYVGVAHAIATTSCTTALELCLRAMGVGLGDEVIVPDFTHPATGLVAKLVGAEPILVDVSPLSYNTTAELVEDAITDRTRCVMPVSIFGMPLEIEGLNRLCEKTGLHMVEDAACSLGAAIDGRRVGSLTESTCFSFHPRKVFATGDGGLITTDDSELASLLNSLKRFGVEQGPEGSQFVRVGSNYRFSNILGAVALGQVRRMDAILGRRRDLAEAYDDLFSGVPGIRIPRVPPNCRHSFQSYVLYVEGHGVRDKLISGLRARGVEAQIGTYALHEQPIFRSARCAGDLSTSSDLFRKLMAIPLHGELSDEDQHTVHESVVHLLRELA